MKRTILTTLLLTATLSGCGGGGGSSIVPIPPMPAPQPITITGTVTDGPVTGGRVFIFAVDDINAALDGADLAEDRLTSLQAAGALLSRARTAADGETFSIDLPGGFADTPVYIVFDNTGAVDDTFGDQPLNMETVVVLGADGNPVTANITPHTSMITTQVRASAATSASDVAAEIATATTSVIAAMGSDEFGNPLFADGTDIVGSTDTESLAQASTFVGGLVRATSAISGISQRDVLLALGADSADGDLDGAVPSGLTVADTIVENAAEVADSASAGRLDFDIAGGTCSGAANLMASACEFNVMDDFLEGRGICQNTDDEDELAECLGDISDQAEENIGECEAVHEARLDLCEDLDDQPHVPEFGEEFADNFVDPRDIGISVEPNPWLPLIAGNTWVYEGTFSEEVDEDEGVDVNSAAEGADEDDIDGESTGEGIDDQAADEEITDGNEADDDPDNNEGAGEEVLITEVITVTVTGKVKLIEGILCVVVNDRVTEDGELIENTDDWYAQDKAGNVWYCGEIAENFEAFEDDEPATPELVDIEGSWKHARDTGEAGMLLPFLPVEDNVLRQEVLYGEAEDAIEILSLEGNESTEAASCNGMCLVTRDFTPLEPDVEEHKFYVSGIGQILEVDLESGARVELISFTQGTQ
jgi:hypothetical protein